MSSSAERVYMSDTDVATGRARDRAAIEELRAAYCYRLDDGDVDGWVDLFTEDAVVDYVSRDDLLVGREAIRGLAREWIVERDETRVHTVHNPVIELDGDTASGRWYYRAVTLAPDGSGLREQGRYDEQYRRVDGDWKIARLETTVTYEAPAEAGWADVDPHR
jgi:ketosteroid isomerase-like protein